MIVSDACYVGCTCLLLLDLFLPPVPDFGVRPPQLAVLVDADGNRFNNDKDHDRGYEDAVFLIDPLCDERQDRDGQPGEYNH